MLLAVAMDSPSLEDRRLTLDKVSKPTTMIVRRIINMSVTINAKPRLWTRSEEGG